MMGSDGVRWVLVVCDITPIHLQLSIAYCITFRLSNITRISYSLSIFIRVVNNKIGLFYFILFFIFLSET